METSWHKPEIYQSSTTSPGFDDPTAQELKKLQDSLQKSTRTIVELPYDPAAWLVRAEVLLRLGYPELMLGDCFKARLLLEAVEEKTKQKEGEEKEEEEEEEEANIDLLGSSTQELYQIRLGECVKLHLGMRFWLEQDDEQHCPIPIEDWPQMAWKMRFRRKLREVEWMMLRLMNEGFGMAQCYYESIKICREGKVKFRHDPCFQPALHGALPIFLGIKEQRSRIFPNASATELKVGQMTGLVKMRCYPWIAPALLRRAPELIASIKNDLVTASADKCALRPSNIRDKIMAETGLSGDFDVFGAFAATDLSANEVILIDNTVTAVLDMAKDRCDSCCGVLYHGSFSLPCCSVTFCTSKCAERARKTYHAAVCGRDLTNFQNASGDGVCMPDTATEELLLLRCLAISVQGGWHQPLQTPIIAQLTASYPPKYTMPYNFQHRIVRPIRMLQLLGVDVFTNLNYDTWVLFTMQMRLNTNQRDGGLGAFGSVTMLALNPLQTFFNHSCRPNVTAMPDLVKMSSTSTLKARRHIRAGEELCIEYTHQILQPLATRRKALEPWLGADCQCERCVAEEDELSQSGT